MLAGLYAVAAFAGLVTLATLLVTWAWNAVVVEYLGWAARALSFENALPVMLLIVFIALIRTAWARSQHQLVSQALTSMMSGKQEPKK